MEYSCPVYVQGRTQDYSYDVNLSPLHGHSFYNPEDDEQFSIESDHVLSQPDSNVNVLARWAFRISGSLDDPNFEQQLESGLEMVTLPFLVRFQLFSAIIRLVRRRPSALTRVSFGVHALIDLYLDEDQEGDEEEEEDSEFLDEMEMDRASSQGFVVLELEKVKIEGEKKKDRCAICLEEFITDSKAAKLYCSHIFHDDCVRQWLENRGTCPMCRSALSVSTQ